MQILPQARKGVACTSTSLEAMFMQFWMQVTKWFVAMGAAALAFSTGYAKYVVNPWLRSWHVGTKALLLFDLNS